MTPAILTGTRLRAHRSELSLADAELQKFDGLRVEHRSTVAARGVDDAPVVQSDCMSQHADADDMVTDLSPTPPAAERDTQRVGRDARHVLVFVDVLTAQLSWRGHHVAGCSSHEIVTLTVFKLTDL